MQGLRNVEFGSVEVTNGPPMTFFNPLGMVAFLFQF